MKRSLLLNFLVCTAFLSAYGQGTGSIKYMSSQQSVEDRAHIATILATQNGRHAAAKTTTQKKRLIAYSYAVGGMLEDTGRFYYSASRGSTHPHLYSYRDVFSPREYKSMIGGNNMDRQLIKCDSSLTWNAQNNFDLVIKRSYTYDQQQRMTSMVDSNVLWYYSKADFKYDATGRLTSYVSYDTGGATAMIPKMEVYIQYDAQGKRIVDSGVSLITSAPLSKIIYTYDNNDKLLSRVYSSYYLGTWNPTFRYDYLYDSNNRLLRYSAMYYYMGGFIHNFKDSFEYTGTNTGFTTYTNFYYNSNDQEWVPDFREINVVNGQGLVDTYYVHDWTGLAFDTIEKDVVIYDSDGLVQHTNGFAYMGNGVYSTAPYDQQTMYYETYIDLDVDHLQAPSALSVYPNPSTGLLNVKRTSGAPASAEVYGADGKLIQQLTLIREVERINTGGLAPGTYYLLIREKQTGVLYRKSFVML